MDHLIKKVLEEYNWKYILTFVCSLTLPSLIFIFVWDKQIFVEMDTIKLLLFSFATGLFIFLPNSVCVAICCYLEEMNGGKENDIIDMFATTIIITILEISLAIIHKLSVPAFTIIEFVVYVAIALLLIVVIKIVIERKFICGIIKNRAKEPDN